MVAHRQWSHVRLLKRFAQSVCEKLESGTLAVLCRACPQPDINMDPDWKNRPSEGFDVPLLLYVVYNARIGIRMPYTSERMGFFQAG